MIVPSHLRLRCSSVRFRNLPRHVFTWSHPRPTPPVTAKCIGVGCRGFYIVLDGLAGLGMVLSFEYGLGWYGRLQNGWSSSRTVTTSQLKTNTWSMSTISGNMYCKLIKRHQEAIQHGTIWHISYTPLYAHQLLALLSIVVSSSVAQTSVTAAEWWWLLYRSNDGFVQQLVFSLERSISIIFYPFLGIPPLSPIALTNPKHEVWKGPASPVDVTDLGQGKAQDTSDATEFLAMKNVGWVKKIFNDPSPNG